MQDRTLGELAEADNPEYERIRKELDRRCAAKSLSIEERRSGGDIFLTIEMPCGREKRSVFMFMEEELRAFLGVAFEDLVFLGRYDAICSYAEGSIEAAVRPTGSIANIRNFAARLSGRDIRTMEPDDFGISLELAHPSGRPTIRLENPSERMNAVTARRFRGPSLKIEGTSLSNHDEAVNLLERLSDSLFFQIEMAYGVALTLSTPRHGRRRLGETSKRERIELEFPRMEYDRAPLSLYWYGCSAVGMPLLQFLAYYQAVEYYYPAYSQAAARRRVRALLKDPTFRVDKESDVARLVAATRGHGQGIGDERSQLKSTIDECVDATALRQFITQVPDRAKFLASKVDGLTSRKIPIANESADLRGDVAERLYEIRCKIVHTKGTGPDGELEMLLPFSKEAELLQHDVEVMKFVTRATLVAASSVFKL
jgi:hypothetical protein